MSDVLYPLKSISFLNRSNVRIVCQNENGPCPLIALVNALSLMGNLTLFDTKDNWISLDIGLSVKNIHLNADFSDVGGTEGESLDLYVPAVYLNAEFAVPVTGLIVGVTVEGLQIQEHEYRHQYTKRVSPSPDRVRGERIEGESISEERCKAAYIWKNNNQMKNTKT